ncbi:hypothetical protein JCM19232_1591 [Vibrio ishigakensis]|uniref:Integral membrane protein n=1 Tax=Vibrio ishigakensis TaxID=1481914 RepID=A0A0B8PTY3_9VIBR|nr:hypothetical protein JCM19232_1591 [Vibrio ishigakensis]
MSALVLAQSEKALLMYVLLTLPSVVSATRRRLHDSGHSSWWLLAGLLPVIGTLMLLLQLLRKGQPHHNRFGPNPRVWLE